MVRRARPDRSGLASARPVFFYQNRSAYVRQLKHARPARHCDRRVAGRAAQVAPPVKCRISVRWPLAPSKVPTAQTLLLAKANTALMKVLPWLTAPGSGLETIFQPPAAEPYSISEDALPVATD